MADTPHFSPIDPNCGSAGMLFDAQRLVDASYNQLPLAHLEGQLELPFDDSSRAEGHRTTSESLRFRRLSERVMRHERPSGVLFCSKEEWPVVANFFTRFADVVISSVPLDLLTVDTLWVSLPMRNVTVLADHQLKVERNRDEGWDDLLWKSAEGAPVKGKKAWLHRDGLHVDINRPRRGRIDGDDIGCLIQFSIPGIQGQGDNSWPANRRTTVGLIASVQNKLADLGLVIDLRQAKVVRCELNRSIPLNEPFVRYQQIWKGLNVPRTTQKDHGPTGVSRVNDNQVVLFYDKIAEMKRRGLSTTHLPASLGRLEWRIIGGRNVTKKLGVKTVQDLLDNWETLEALYLTYKNSLFCYDVKTLQTPRPRRDRPGQSPIQAEIALLMRWCQKRGIEHNLDASELEKIVLSGDLDVYAEKIKAVSGMDRKHANRSVNRMRDGSWRENFQNEDFVRRYLELKEKLEGGKCWPNPQSKAGRLNLMSPY